MLVARDGKLWTGASVPGKRLPHEMGDPTPVETVRRAIWRMKFKRKFWAMRVTFGIGV